MGDIRECGEFERAGNGKTGPNTFSVVQDRQEHPDGRPGAGAEWKKKREEKQWLQKQGYIAKEPESAGTPAAAKNENGGALETKPEPSSLNVNEILDNYVAAGHHTTIIPALSGRSGPHGAAGIDFTRETGILRRKF